MVLPATQPQTFDGDRYLVTRVLGQGGMGVVYDCTDQRLSRQVAIKTVAAGQQASRVAVEMFLHEARALAALDHPNLVRIFDARHEAVGDTGLVYLVMERVDGDPLDRLLPSPGWSLGQRLGLMAQVAEALSCCHQAGIIHRDIKPGNILVRRDGRVKLVDFGLARSLDLLGQRTTEVRGTPAYMSPEQLLGEPLGPATDLYALGATLFEVLAGRPPFPDHDAIYHQVHTPPPALASLCAVPRAIEELVEGCLQKDPRARPRDAAAVALLLRTWAERQDDESAMAAAAGPAVTAGELRPGSGPVTGAQVPLRRLALPWIVMGAVLLAGLWFARAALLGGPRSLRDPQVAEVAAEQGVELAATAEVDAKPPAPQAPPPQAPPPQNRRQAGKLRKVLAKPIASSQPPTPQPATPTAPPPVPTAPAAPPQSAPPAAPLFF